MINMENKMDSNYVDTLADYIKNNIDTDSQYTLVSLINGSFSEFKDITTEMGGDYHELAQKYVELSELLKEVIEKNQKDSARERLNFAKYNILLDAIAVSPFCEDVVKAIEDWKQDMTDDETGETVDHETSDYDSVIDDLKTLAQRYA